jgi:hypothetical protein
VSNWIPPEKDYILVNIGERRVIWAYKRYQVNFTLVIWHFMSLFTKDMTVYDVISCFMNFGGIIHEGFMALYDMFWQGLLRS